MKPALQSIITGLVFLYLLFASHSLLSSDNLLDNYIIINNFTTFQVVQDAEPAVINWDFENVDYVTISGSPTRYKSKDRIELQTSGSNIIEVLAHHQSTDFIALKSYIFRKNTSEATLLDMQVRKGPTIPAYNELSRSFNESSFINGLIGESTSKPPYSLKIMRMKIKDQVNMEYFIRMIILDKFGNYIEGLKSSNKKINWFADNNCINGNEDPILVSVNNFKEINRLKSEDALDLSILVDNSSSTDTNLEIYEYLKIFFGTLAHNDNVMLSYFNQDFYNLFSLQKPQSAISQISKSTMPKPSGMNSMYKALHKAISEFKSKNRKAMILITYMSDNSSIIYTANDVANYALAEDIPIYIIGIGNAVESYALKYITNLTGGKYYQLFNGDTEMLSEILREIAFSQKAYYELELPMPMHLLTCSKMRMEITSDIDGDRCMDSYEVIAKPQVQYSQYQLAAAFEELSSSLSDEYLSILVSIAKVLTDNPSAVIELVGNNGIHEKGAGKNLALARAEAVKNVLINYGASHNQIRVRSEGASRPRYYLEMSEWQKKLNRRVEVRWLYPAMLPYEILAEKAKSEQEAIEKSEVWEKRGHPAYYERYLEDNEIMYRVKIWGFRTLNEAQQTAESLKKKFNIKAEVQ